MAMGPAIMVNANSTVKTMERAVHRPRPLTLTFGFFSFMGMPPYIVDAFWYIFLFCVFLYINYIDRLRKRHNGFKEYL